MVRLLAPLLAFLGWLTSVHLQPRRHLGYIFLIILRVGALALSPLLTLLSLLLWRHHWRRRDWVQQIAALLATVQFGQVAFAQTQPVIDSHRLPIPRMPLLRLRPFLPPSIPFRQNVPIAPGLKADLWPPAGSHPSGVAILYLHPSAWHYLKKDLLHGTRPLFNHWAQQGHLILDLDYTLAPAANVPTMLAEVRQAIRWLKTEGRAYDVHPDKIILMGGSAGGNLAQLAAYTAVDHSGQAPAAVAGVISLYGVSDLLALQQHLDQFPRIPDRFTPLLHWLDLLPEYGRIVNTADMLPSCLGCQVEETVVYRHFSPIHQVTPDCPPTLLLHGRHDFGSPVTQSRHLFLTLKQANVPVQLIEFPCVDHMFDIILPQIAPPTTTAVACLDQFICHIASDYVN